MSHAVTAVRSAGWSSVPAGWGSAGCGASLQPPGGRGPFPLAGAAQGGQGGDRGAAGGSQDSQVGRGGSQDSQVGTGSIQDSQVGIGGSQDSQV